MVFKIVILLNGSYLIDYSHSEPEPEPEPELEPEPGCQDIFNIVYTSTPSTTVENNVTTAVNKLKHILNCQLPTDVSTITININPVNNGNNGILGSAGLLHFNNLMVLLILEKYFKLRVLLL